MRYYRHDLDQIAAVLDLTAHALSILFIRAPSSPFLSLAFSSSLALFRSSLAAGLKIGAGLKVPVWPCARSNESMKNNTCPGPVAKIVNAPRIYSV